MDSLMNAVAQLIAESTAAKIGLILIAYALLGAILLRTELGRRMIMAIGMIFYSERRPNSSDANRRRIRELEKQVHTLRQLLTNKNTDSQRAAVQSELERQLSSELPGLVKKKLEELKSLDPALEPSILQAVTSYLDRHDPNSLVEAKRELVRLNERQERTRMLELTIEEQMRSAGRLKAVMINLFVIFNIGILLFYIFAASSVSDRAVTGIIGLYVSLAAFIVYIYRTSNFRSSVLLALREDAKKYFDAADYISRLKDGLSPGETDVEILKLLLINRAEREKLSEHPYEIVLRGISNSNIQLKGGKMFTANKPSNSSH